MKIKFDFVTNSSSTAFILNKNFAKTTAQVMLSHLEKMKEETAKWADKTEQLAIENAIKFLSKHKNEDYGFIFEIKNFEGNAIVFRWKDKNFAVECSINYELPSQKFIVSGDNIESIIDIINLDKNYCNKVKFFNITKKKPENLIKYVESMYGDIS